MKSTRTKAILIVTICACLAMAISVFNRDTKTKAAYRLGNAFINNDPDVVWSFIASQERSTHSMDRAKFGTFWKTVVAPSIREMKQVELDPLDNMELTVKVFDAEKRRGLAFPVVSRQGQYITPDFFHHCTLALGAQGFVAGDMKTASSRYFLHVSAWLRDNKAALQSTGLTGIKTGVDKPMRSIDELAAAYENAARSLAGGGATAPSQ